MRNREEILEAFSGDKFFCLNKLKLWKYKELKELRERYQYDYNLTNSDYIYNRIVLIDEAITIKHGNDEQIWDYITIVKQQN